MISNWKKVPLFALMACTPTPESASRSPSISVHLYRQDGYCAPAPASIDPAIPIEACTIDTLTVKAEQADTLWIDLAGQQTIRCPGSSPCMAHTLSLQRVGLPKGRIRVCAQRDQRETCRTIEVIR